MQLPLRLVAFVAAVALIFGLSVSWARAQPRVYEPTGRVVVSGDNLGFRIVGKTSDGRPMGRLVIRQDGEWVEPNVLSGGPRVVTEK